jgi:hypothetical protein
MKAYHFLKEDMKAGSGSERPWKIGEERTVKNPKRIALCEYGYHSAPSWRAALRYAPGPVACIVEVSIPIRRDETKSVSATRKLLVAKDVAKELRLFACDCAERALKAERKAGREPDERSWCAIIVSRRYANGEATLEELSAADSAAYFAAYSAAYFAAYRAAYSAADSAADSAAYSAADSAAYFAAYSAEREWQRKRLAKYLNAALGETS